MEETSVLNADVRAPSSGQWLHRFLTLQNDQPGLKM